MSFVSYSHTLLFILNEPLISIYVATKTLVVFGELLLDEKID